jgi:hypothetical protein
MRGSVRVPVRCNGRNDGDALRDKKMLCTREQKERYGCREGAHIHGQRIIEMGWRAGAVEMAGVNILEGQ